MDLLLYAAFAALVMGPLVVWQVLPRFAVTTEDLRDDNFQKIYDGQDRWPGSKEANDEVRKVLSDKGIDLSQPQIIEHLAERIEHSSSTKAKDLSCALESDRYKGFAFAPEGHAVSFKQTAVLGSMVFDRQTMELNDFLHEHGWSYKGWDHAIENYQT